MKFKSIKVSVMVFIVTTISLSSYGEEMKTESLDALIVEGLANNPGIKAAHSEWEAERHKISQASAFPDPMAEFSFKTMETKRMPHEQEYGIEQTVPFIPKLGLERTRQNKRAGMLKVRYEAAKREIIRSIKNLYYDMFWVDQTIEILGEEKTILENLEKVAEKKYESNLTSQQDVIKAQVEITKLINDLALLRQNRKSLEARMNSILARPREAELTQVRDVELAGFNQKLDDLLIEANSSRQELQEARLGIKEAEYEKTISEFEYIPDTTLGLNYIDDKNGDDAWKAEIKVNVPFWFDRLGAKVREKKAMLESTRKKYEDVKNTVDYEVKDLYFKVTTYWDIVLLYKTALVPQAEQSFNVSKTAYETGKVDFLNWLESERMLLRTKVAYHRAVSDYLKSIADLERIVGKDL